MSRIQAPAAVEKHSIPPFFGSDSQILILGSFPSVKSRESGFYYGHPQNRFWRVLSSVFDAPLPQTIEQKQEFLRTHYIALWDVAAECSIRGSADSSISAVTANDIAPLLRSTQIKAVFLNGQTAQKLFRKYLSEETAKFGCTVTTLPSTSPANASYSLEKLAAEWGNPHRPCDLRIGVNVRNFACILKVYPKFLSNCEFQRL